MIRSLLHTGVSLTLLALLAWWLDAGALFDRLSGFDPRWALVAIAISLAQITLLAFRWRFTAGRLGLDLPFGAALRSTTSRPSSIRFFPAASWGTCLALGATGVLHLSVASDPPPGP